jgi:glycosyltransferase involved in cell wall biosynthesis
MKILIVSEMSVPYVVGGGEVRYWLLTRELTRRGHNVTWLSMRQKTSLDIETIDAARHLHVGPRIESPPTRPLLAMLRFGFAAFFHILTNRYDAVDAQTYAPLPFVWLACVLSGQKMVATIHDVSRGSDGQWLTNRFRRLTRITETLLYRIPYRHIIAVSESTAIALVERHGVSRSRIRIIPNGIELPERASVASDSKDIDLIFAGRFVPTKNIEDLIEITRISHAAGAARKAILVGDGPLHKPMLERIQLAGLADVIQCPGRKDNAEVLGLLARAKVFFHASSREGFPVVMVEAMACELPVVAYDVPGVVDVIENNVTGILVPERDVQAHAKACIDLLSSNDRRSSLAAAGREMTVQMLSSTKMADRILDVYSEN